MSKFEDQLFNDLIQEHGPALAVAKRPKAPRNTRPVWIAAGALAVAGAATAGITLFSGGTPAFAVTENPDGSVTVAVKDLSGLDAANRELARRGLPTMVPTLQCIEIVQSRLDQHGVIFDRDGTITFTVGDKTIIKNAPDDTGSAQPTEPVRILIRTGPDGRVDMVPPACRAAIISGPPPSK